MVDGSEYVVFYLREAGNPIQEVYAVEGSPLISGQVAVMQQAPHPNAARLFAEYLFTARCQQLMADLGGTRSFHPDVKLKPGRKPLSEIKVLRSVPTALEASVDEVKQKYTEYFGV
jgi:iron(III) transport system substrate-binding protein